MVVLSLTFRVVGLEVVVVLVRVDDAGSTGMAGNFGSGGSDDSAGNDVNCGSSGSDGSGESSGGSWSENGPDPIMRTSQRRSPMARF